MASWELPPSLSVAGKRAVALAVHLTNHSLPGANLIYIKDMSSNISYLIDSALFRTGSWLLLSGLAIVMQMIV
jgi:hypothetical protein